MAYLFKVCTLPLLLLFLCQKGQAVPTPDGDGPETTRQQGAAGGFSNFFNGFLSGFATALQGGVAGTENLLNGFGSAANSTFNGLFTGYNQTSQGLVQGVSSFIGNTSRPSRP